MAKIIFFRRIAGILLFACLALYYAHLEIEIVKTSFIINRHRQTVSFLLDQHRTLVYNLSRLESPARITDMLDENKITLSMPRKENIRRFEEAEAAYALQRISETKGNSFMARLLDRLTPKAEAKVIK